MPPKPKVNVKVTEDGPIGFTPTPPPDAGRSLGMVGGSFLPPVRIIFKGVSGHRDPVQPRHLGVPLGMVLGTYWPPYYSAGDGGGDCPDLLTMRVFPPIIPREPM